MIHGLTHFNATDDYGLIDGVPLQEMAVHILIGNCSRCDAVMDDSLGGMIENKRVVKGVLMGDIVCIDCLPDGRVLFETFMEEE